ncbi:hypothetical protein EDC19_2019 [Natranaerovirga hydrolytica]|uniref:Uncharacterized protein n=1 Tax=Natranaerovirga hydrolytica TaxID=680378 RepID=A0A4R1MSG2_9FIRM|nr:hypothetical protein [Natranaerovirga hydrolytica]TCK92863.1 hypothetical protein EDC19_2019 [Natranaerovirga hydrolytica]
MEEEKKVEDIVKMMTGQLDTSDIINEIVNSINKITKEKFLDNINSVVSSYKEKSIQQSNKEINLLNAMKEFVPTEKKQEIDKFTNLFSEYKALTGMIQDFQNVSMNTQQNPEDKGKVNNKEIMKTELIEEENTIYEIDKECQGRVNTTNNGTGSMLPLLLILFLGIK